MALNARLFTHNILRVSNLKKLSHTTQAIERNSDKNTVSLGVHTQSLQGQDFTLSACQYLTYSCQERIPVNNLDVMTRRMLKIREKNLTSVLFPQEHLPSVIKAVSYTTDDIFTCPVDKASQLDHSVIYENHSVTILTEPGKDLQHLTHPATDVFHQKNIRSETETDLSVLQETCFRRHSICDLYTTLNQAHFTDCSVLQCSRDSGLRQDAKFYPESSSDALLCSGGPGSGGPEKSADSGGQGPNLDQLRAVETFFIETLPTFFKSRLDYRVYHPDIIFENNFWGENQVSVGINQYAVQMTKLRALTHLKYAHVHMEVISSACIPEENMIRIQWRIVGLSQLKALRFWKYTAWSYSKAFREDAEWVDGISILHVNKDGLIIKHRMDRITPDEEQLVKAPTSLVGKLALLFGLSAPKPSLSDFSSIL